MTIEDRCKEISAEMHEAAKSSEHMVMMLTYDNFNCGVMMATKEEDINQHVDFWCIVGDKKYGIDVKQRARKHRYDDEYSNDSHWVELKNVQGKNGCIFGEALYIAFITKDEVLYCPRKDVVKLVRKHTEGKKATETHPEEYYQPYSRSKYGRKDIIVEVPDSDLRAIARHIIPHNFYKS